MLTPTDIHYLVGLLSVTSHPDNVEVELGSLVYDSASEEARDVDVTISSKDETGETTLLKGIEVKKHSRPLDTTHVEQLAAKLSDMQTITYRGIVSASGYSGPAVKKAEKHGVDLFDLTEWKNLAEGFDHFKSQFCPFVSTSLEWCHGPEMRINPNAKVPEADRPFFRVNPPVFFGENQTHEAAPDLNTLLQKIKIRAQQEILRGFPAPLPGQAREKKVFNVLLKITDGPYVMAPSGKIVLTEVRVSGAVQWVEKRRETAYKILLKRGETKPIAGCCIAEFPGWGLVGISLSNTDRTLRFINIPISARNKQKIFRERIRSS